MCLTTQKDRVTESLYHNKSPYWSEMESPLTIKPKRARGCYWTFSTAFIPIKYANNSTNQLTYLRSLRKRMKISRIVEE